MSPVRETRPLHKLDDPEAFAAAREAFVRSAMEALGRRGDFDFSVAEVVRASGQHNAAFYRVFESKERLLLAVAEEAVKRTVGRLEPKLRAATDAEDAVHQWSSTLLRLAGTEKSAASIEAFALERHRFLRRFPGSDRVLVAPVTGLLADTLARFGRPDAELTASAAFELVMGRQATWIAQRHRPARREVEEWAGVVARLAAPRGAATEPG